MPWGDRTGPMGEGPMTGRGAGYCTGVREYVYPPPRRGFRTGMGRAFGGRGRGFGAWGAAAQPDPEMEKQVLQDRVRALQSEMDLIKGRLDEMDSTNSSS